MNAPPYLLDLRIISPEQQRVRVWLPLFLLWPFALVIGVLALVLTIIADVVLWVAGQRYHYYTMLLLGVFATMTYLRGTCVHIRGDGANVDLTIK